MYARRDPKWSRAVRVSQLRPAVGQTRTGFGSSIAVAGSTVVAAGGADVAADVYVNRKTGWHGARRAQAMLSAGAPPAGQPACDTYRAALQSQRLRCSAPTPIPGSGRC